MKNKAISALMIMGILAGCFVPQGIAFADDDAQTTEGQTEGTDQPSDGDQGTDDTDDQEGQNPPEEKPEPTEEEPVSDPATAGDAYGSGNNNYSTVVTDPSNPVQGMAPAGPENSDVTYVYGGTTSSNASTTPSASSSAQQVHVSNTTYSIDEPSTDLTAIDERAESGSNDENASSIEVPHTGEGDGINMLAVGLLAIAGITVVAAGAVVILMNKLAKRAEAELK